MEVGVILNKEHTPPKWTPKSPVLPMRSQKGLGNVRKLITKCKALMKPRKLAELYKFAGLNGTIQHAYGRTHTPCPQIVCSRDAPSASFLYLG